MGLHNRYAVLYFTRGANPTQAQLDEATHYGPHVMFRNATYISGDETGLEPCTAVAGEIPANYAKAYPKAVSYADWIAGKLPVVAKPRQPAPAEPAGPLDFKMPVRGRAKIPAAAPAAGARGADMAFDLPPPPPQDGPPPQLPPPGAEWTPQG